MGVLSGPKGESQMNERVLIEPNWIDVYEDLIHLVGVDIHCMISSGVRYPLHGLLREKIDVLIEETIREKYKWRGDYENINNRIN